MRIIFIVNEQWFRFQILKMFDILDKKKDTIDELFILNYQMNY